MTQRSRVSNVCWRKKKRVAAGHIRGMILRSRGKRGLTDGRDQKLGTLARDRDLPEVKTKGKNRQGRKATKKKKTRSGGMGRRGMSRQIVLLRNIRKSRGESSSSILKGDRDRKFSHWGEARGSHLFPQTNPQSTKKENSLGIRWGYKRVYAHTRSGGKKISERVRSRRTGKGETLLGGTVGGGTLGAKNATATSKGGWGLFGCEGGAT